MQFKKRYFLLSIVCGGLFLIIFYLANVHDDRNARDRHDRDENVVRRSVDRADGRRGGKFPALVKPSNKIALSYFDEGDYHHDTDLRVSPAQSRRQFLLPPSSSSSSNSSSSASASSVSSSVGLTPKPHQLYHHKYAQCRMETCFNFTKCRGLGGFKVYVYPRQYPVSSSFANILASVEESPYYTADPTQACLFIASVDTLDQDVRSADRLDVQDRLQRLPYWNNGQNHIIFNLYAGTWPDYVDRLDFDVGMAIIAKASFSMDKFRAGFDISFPLFAKNHPLKGGERGFLGQSVNSIPSYRHYLLAFKGKRYLTGVGSETRNSLYHIHNGRDIVLLTTCKHGIGWEKKQDPRCKKDNAEYDKHDYRKLLFNSTFCLVPRGRRLGSFRFLEVLQAACVPVLLSNGWELPFSEVIDWNRVVVWADERLLLQIPTMVRSISEERLLYMRQQTQFLWETYFSSTQKIISTVLELMKDRVQKHLARPLHLWNTSPGALHVRLDFSDALVNFPFFYGRLGASPLRRFTAVVYATSPVFSSSPLFRVLRATAKSAFVHKIVVLWHCDVPPPPSRRWPSDLGVPVLVKTRNIRSVNARFVPYKEIETDAVFSLDEDVLLTTEEIDFAFSVWREFPERIVGYAARGHYWDEQRARWRYGSKWTNSYSMVLTSAAVYHRYYHHLYTHTAPQHLVSRVASVNDCHDILFNFLVAHVTRLPPVKVTQRKQVKESEAAAGSAGGGGVDWSAVSRWLAQQKFAERQRCMEDFVAAFGHMPLLSSELRFDPLLFKDPVSNMRKKYRRIEMVV